MLFHCSICNYITDRKFNLQRHINKKHVYEYQNNELSKLGQNVIPNEQNVIPNGQNVISNEQNVIPNEQNVIPCILSCSKCNKVYKTPKHLHNHEKICNKVDSLTCPRCMISFTNRHNKNRHIKADKCKARSIIHARTPNVQNITNNNTTNNTQNIETMNNYNNIIINNFGSERIDHISHEEIMKMLQSGINTVPLYIQKKHFDKEFPENNNIKYTNDNKCQVLVENSWKEKDINLLSSTLIKDNTEVLLLYCDDNDIKISETIQDTEKYEHVKNKLFIIYNKTDHQKYNQVLTKIKDLIKFSTT